MRALLNPLFIFCCIGHFVDHAVMLAYPVTVLALEAEFGWNYGQLIALQTGAIFMFGLGAMPAGWLGDRWSQRGMMAVMFLGIGVAAVAAGIAPTPILLAVALAVIGLFASIYHPIGTTLVARTEIMRGRALGVNGIFGGLGISAGPLIAALLTQHFGWRAAFVVPGIVCIGIGLAFLWLVPRTDRHAVAKAAQEDAAAPRAAGALRTFLVILAVTAVVGFLFQSTSNAMPKIFEDRLTFLHGDLGAIGWYLFAAFVVGAGFQYLGGWMADLLPLGRLAVIVMAGQGVAMLLAAKAMDWPMFAAAMAVSALLMGTQPITDTLIAHYVPRDWHSRAYGVRFLVAIIVGSAAVPLIGIIRETTGTFDLLFFGGGALALAAALLATTLPRQRANGR